MTTNINQEYVVIGAGTSGLLIAKKLLAQSASVILIGPEDHREQTLCSWRHQNTPEFYIDHIIGSWDQWGFSAQEKVLVQKADRFRYEALNGKTLKTALEIYLSKQLGFTRVKESVIETTTNHEKFIVRTDSNSFNTLNLLDSRPPTLKNETLIQQFYGITIEYEETKKIAPYPILMDFNVSSQTKDAVIFIYVIPMSDKSLMIEATLFGKSLIEEQELRSVAIDWIKKKCHYKEVTNQILFEEKGIIPMGPVSFDRVGQPIGVAAGAARPSSGYTLHGLERQLRKYDMSNNMIDLSTSPYSTRSAWMDNIFLKVLRNNPSVGKDIFLTMAKALTGDQMASFMMDEFSIKQAAQLILALPSKPFVKALLRP
jgi:lycopene beta-cyclase